MSDLPSCWVVTEGLVGLENQAIGLAEALGLPYILKQVRKPKGFWPFLFAGKHNFLPPWPDLLISCGNRSVVASLFIRKASGYKTFTVHIQDPHTDPKQFDAVIVPAHDRMRGPNVFVTQGAVHHVTPEKLMDAAGRFHPLLAALPRPVIGVLIGGKSRHQDFSAGSARDLAGKLLAAVQNTGGGLAITPSRRTGHDKEVILKERLAGVPAYIWDGHGENPYLGILALSDVLIVTSDSISMISEACSTGKPVYIYELPGGKSRHQRFREDLMQSGLARPFSGPIEIWKNRILDETRRAADFVYERFWEKMSGSKADLICEGRR